MDNTCDLNTLIDDAKEDHVTANAERAAFRKANIGTRFAESRMIGQHRARFTQFVHALSRSDMIIASDESANFPQVLSGIG